MGNIEGYFKKISRTICITQELDALLDNKREVPQGASGLLEELAWGYFKAKAEKKKKDKQVNREVLDLVNVELKDNSKVGT